MQKIRKSQIREFWHVRNTANGLVALDEGPPERPDLLDVPLPRLEDELADRPEQEVRAALEREDRPSARQMYERELGVG